MSPRVHTCVGLAELCTGYSTGCCNPIILANKKFYVFFQRIGPIENQKHRIIEAEEGTIAVFCMVHYY